MDIHSVWWITFNHEPFYIYDEGMVLLFGWSPMMSTSVYGAWRDIEPVDETDRYYATTRP